MKFRKKITKGLAMSMALSMLFCNTAFATEIDLANSTESVTTDTLNKSEGTDHFADEENEWLNGTINEEVRVTVDLASQFEITIPKEIILDGETGKADYKVKAVGDIAGDQKLSVVPDTEFILSEKGGKDDTLATVTQNNTGYTYTELQGSGTEYDGSISATLTAGEWSGKFNFNIGFIDLSTHVHSYKVVSSYTKSNISTYNLLNSSTETNVIKCICSCGDSYTISVPSEERINIQGTISWDDYNDFYKVRPEEIPLKLEGSNLLIIDGVNCYCTFTYSVKEEADPTITDEIYIVWDKNVENEEYDTWQYTIYNLPTYGNIGDSINYKIYDNYSDNGYNYSSPASNNTRYIDSNNTLNMDDINKKFTKQHTIMLYWTDGYNKQNLRAESVTINLEYSKDNGVTWEKLPDSNNPDNFITTTLTSENVVANTNDATWQYTFKQLPSYINEDGNILPIEYKCTFAKFDDIEFVNDSAVCYVGSTVSINESITQLKLSISSTKCNVTLRWIDNDNSSSLRPGTVAIDIEYSSDDGMTWEKFTDSSLTSSREVKDENGKYNLWKRTIYSLPTHIKTDNTYKALKYRSIVTAFDDVEVVDGLVNSYIVSEPTIEHRESNNVHYSEIDLTLVE